MANVSALSKRVTNENSLDEPKDKAHSASANWVVPCTPVTLFKLYNAADVSAAAAAIIKANDARSVAVTSA